jgi:hypothetical protein
MVLLKSAEIRRREGVRDRFAQILELLPLSKINNPESRQSPRFGGASVEVVRTKNSQIWWLHCHSYLLNV